MLSRTARLAAVLVIGQGVFMTAGAQPAVQRFSCGDPAPTICCIKMDDCSSGIYCCYYDVNENQSGCGCQEIS